MDILMGLIEEEAEKSELKPEKKRELLIVLAGFQDPRSTEIAARLLTDFDEGVRYAAAEVLIALEDSENIREALLSALSNAEEESNRLRVRIAEIVGGRDWPLGSHTDLLVSNAPFGWSVNGNRLSQTSN